MGEGDQWLVKFKKGARGFVSKAFKFSHMVAGSLAKMFKDRREEKEVQNDILQET